MSQKLTIILIITVVVLSIFSIIGVYFGHQFYDSIFRLSLDQVSNSLVPIVPQCKKVIECKLLPGDILIRRYITSHTWSFDKFINPYFTHTAFYLGNGYLVEAIGTQKNSEDEIRIVTLEESDWLNTNMDNFVIIRPKNYSLKLDIIENNLKNIAEDADYIFGFPKQGHKRAMCADLIFGQLSDQNIINDPNSPKIITPDYLFWATKNNPNDFEIIGYNIYK